jgi:exosortase
VSAIGQWEDRDRLSFSTEQRAWALIGVLTLALLWAFGNGLAEVVGAWDDPQYSHGYLIPLFSIVLLWLRRQPFEEVPAWERWAGVGIVLLSMLVRLVGAVTVSLTLDRLMFVPCLLGVFVIAGGFRALRWAGPPILFLAFMYPLPRAVNDGLLRPLQSLATGCSLFALQTLGIESFRDGNRIVMENVQIGVVDACSGLRMATIFLALAAGLAMISTNRPWWERLTILLSAIPIALAANVIRITVTGVLYSFDVNREIAKMVFHDFAGWIMMPIAIGLLYLETQILSRLFIEEAPIQLQPIGPRFHQAAKN